MSLYFFKHTDGYWVLGQSPTSICSSGRFSMTPLDGGNSVIISDSPTHSSTVYLEVVSTINKDAIGTKYASYTELLASTKEFFLSSTSTVSLIDPSGHPATKPDLVDTTSETITYEGYKSGATYIICKLDASTAIFSRTWSTGAWADRTTLIYS